MTGGHLAPALGVMDEIAKTNEIVFVGRKYSLDKEKTISLEYQEIKKRGVPFYHLSAGRFTRLATLRTLINLVKIPLGFLQAFKIIKKEKPDIILSFGGYISFPICVIGYLLKIPIFLHEQTIRPGFANRLTAVLAKKIFVAFPESINYFPSKKVIVSGNPVRKSILKIIAKPFAIYKNKPIIYVTGGSLGSHSLNSHLENILDELLSDYIVIQQTGNVKEYGDFARLDSKRDNLPDALKNNYFLKTHFFEDELGYIYSIADLVISRSGANTIFELIVWQKPSILIPLPWSANQEQLKHAQLMHNAGVAEIFKQSDDSKHLLKLIKKIFSQIDMYKNNFKNLNQLYRHNAASIIVKTIAQNNS